MDSPTAPNKKGRSQTTFRFTFLDLIASAVSSGRYVRAIRISAARSSFHVG